MKKVLEVFGEPISRGGQESYVMTTLQNMDLSDLKVDLFTPYYCDNQEFLEFINRIGGKIIHNDLPFIVGGSRREIIPCFDRYLKEHKYDIVHIHSGSTSVLAYYAKVASKNGVKKIIVHSHSSGSKENLKHLLVKLYTYKIFNKYATDFCAASPEAAIWKYPRNVLPDVKILNNGIDLLKYKFSPNIRRQMRNNLQISDDCIVLGHVGRFTAEKNQIYIVNMLKRYISIYPNDDVKLILIGSGNELDKVKQKVRDLDLDNKIYFMGALGNISDYLQAMDVFLFPSVYEGLGIAGIEAQATGLPVICSMGIPKTMKVTNNVTFIDLNKMDDWCHEIHKVKNYTRKNLTNMITENGYNIVNTADIVRKMYFS